MSDAGSGVGTTGGPVSLDVSVARGAVAGTPTVDVSAKRYNPAQDRERKRGQMATWLIVILGGTILAPFVLILVRGACMATTGDGAQAQAGTCAGLPVVDLMAVLQLVVTPVVALVGAATGFYFGEKVGDSNG